MVKESVLSPETNRLINRNRIINLVGIGSEIVPTLGEVRLIIKGLEASFHVVSESFPIPQEGILGIPFLKKHNAILDFDSDHLQIGNLNLPFSNNKSINLPARTKRLVKIQLKNTTLKEGYISRIQCGPGIFAGESLVLNEKGKIKIFIINSTNQQVNLTIPLVELEEYSLIYPPINSTEDHNLPNKERKRASRFSQILKLIDFSDLNDEEKGSLFPVLLDYSEQFHLPSDKLGSTNVVTHKIITTDNKPIHTKQYRYPPIHREEILRQTKELLSSGIIQPSVSPYNSSLWILPKKLDSSGKKKWRMVIDYRALNEKTVGDSYPLPQITEILDQLGGAKYFSVMDLASGFHQIPMDSDSKSKTAFSTPYAHYEFNRMPFGLRNAPATFQRVMDQVLTGLQGIELFVYMDDIVVYASSLVDHAQKLKALLGRLKTAGLSLQSEKCYFLKKEIAYLGHVITQEGVKPDPRKIEAVKNVPVPKGKKNIKQFLGLVGYYRRFIHNFAKIAQRLTQILKEDFHFRWTSIQHEAFEILRDKICSEPILQYPDFTKQFLLTTDASNYALGGILSQGKISQGLPISYASRTLHGAELNYSTIEKELLAIVFCVNYFRPYLYGHKFVLVTDHRPLV